MSAEKIINDIHALAQVKPTEGTTVRQLHNGTVMKQTGAGQFRYADHIYLSQMKCCLMCHPSGRHFTESSKRIQVFPGSNNLVVNSVSLSRDLPVITGFLRYSELVLKIYSKRGTTSRFHFHLTPNLQEIQSVTITIFAFKPSVRATYVDTNNL